MNIALCCHENSEELRVTLGFYGKVVVFSGLWDRTPGVQLAEYLIQNKPCDLAVVVLDGAEGMNDCRKIKNYKKDLPLLWISDQDAFWAESRRMGVEEFLVKPVPEGMLQKVVEHLLY
ncbi:MAG: hypothetical protein ACRC7V_07345 [Lachnospiraceae bacterium]